MIIQQGENNRDCILASAAMVMDIPIKDLKERIGHDGGEKIFDAPEPYCFRGFHIQEIIDQAFLLGWSVMNIQARPGLAPYLGKGEPYMIELPELRIKTYLKQFPGIIAGVMPQRNHAVAWNKRKIFDPSGKEYGLKDFEFIIKEFWAFSKTYLTESKGMI